MTLQVRPYAPADMEDWNRVVAASRNGNFLHDRRYMDYHAERFEDCSLVVEEGGKAVAVMPASRHGREVVSHGGLTYGGLLSSEDLRAELTLETMRQILGAFRDGGAERLVYKAMPSIFHRYPSQEDLYALFRYDAKLFRRDLSSVVELARPASFSKGRKWSVNKSRKTSAQVVESSDFTGFHQLLQDALRKFDAVPTHSREELDLLQSRFPSQIRLFECRADGDLLAATVVYDFGDTVHTQYMASSTRGRDEGALDRLIADLMQDVFKSKRYFSFGISTENGGTVLNEGLVAQKEGFGARAVVHDFYEVPLKHNTTF
jgi:hypothetical protein